MIELHASRQKRRGIEMKKTIILLIASALIVMSAGSVFAHPPKPATVRWDQNRETLQVSAQHNVNDPDKHYVLTMTIFEGNRQLLLKQYTRQDSADGFNDSVILKNVKSGSKIRIQLVCNIMGSSETEFTIP